MLQPCIQRRTVGKENREIPPVDPSSLQRFPKPPSSLGSMDWHQSFARKANHLLLFHGEDAFLKMYLRGELSEAKEEEDGALTSPTKLAPWLSCSLS
ncbi:hypothetical protein CesoFtcFv8_004276 [Champsocephalus esox]|uniref:Uncharacterized protein n=1 Tax=Champsocephalus esox TaxID=159716 RepID=A0AAN8CYG9_9TELE|nr:hypothetical protein CesoFtcFv8_004276 [Champsocephalus esox]